MTDVRLKENLSSANTLRGPSPNIWGDCEIELIRNGRIAGTIFEDDFLDFPYKGTQTTQIAHGRYKVYAEGTGYIRGASNVGNLEVGNGVLRVQPSADDDVNAIAQSYPSFRLTSTAQKLWFEARLCQSTIINNTVGWMIGLAETAHWNLASNVPFDGSSALIDASASVIGFKHEEDGVGKLDTCYNDRATTLTNIQATVHTVAAYEWIKLGMVFDPHVAVADRIKFYVNNLKTTTPMSNATLTGLTNLDAGSLGLIFAQVADTSLGLTFIDWWKCVQLG